MLGHPKAMFNVGCNYMSGHGLEKDLVKAAEWFQQASDVGFMHGKLPSTPPSLISILYMYVCILKVYYAILYMRHSWSEPSEYVPRRPRRAPRPTQSTRPIQ